MGLKVSNNATTTLAGGISASDTTIILKAGDGSLFPALGAGDWFYGTLVNASNQLEVVKVTARATDTLTVVRGQDGTTARAYALSDRFELRPTAAMFNDKANLDSPTFTTKITTPKVVLNGVEVGNVSPYMASLFPATNRADARWVLQAAGVEGNESIGGNKIFQGENTHNGTNQFNAAVAFNADAGFNSNAYAQTPAQFDSSTKIATTAFVQQAGFHFQLNTGGIGINANRTMSVAEAGRWAEVTAAGVTVTLPPIASVVGGSTYTFKTNAAFTLKASGTEQILAGGSIANSFPIWAKQTLTVAANGAGNHWYVVLDGFGANAFSSSLATNGYQYLPGGRLEQWGTLAVNTDIPPGGLEVQVWFGSSFPSAVYNCVASIYHYGTFNNILMTERALTTSYVKYAVFEGSSGVQSNWGIRWRAIGE